PRAVRQGANGAKVVHVGRKLGEDALFEVRRDFHVLAAPYRAELLDARDFRHEADAARAVDAAGHECPDQRTDILLLDRALVLLKARAAEAEGHRLVLQVAFATLIADRTIERVVDEQKFQNTFARLLHHRRVGVDHLGAAVLVRRQIADAHGAGGNRLRHADHLDEAHTAVAGDRQTLVVAEAGDGHARLLASLDQREAILDLDELPVDDELFRHSNLSNSTQLPEAEYFGHPGACRRDPPRRLLRCPWLAGSRAQGPG